MAAKEIKSSFWLIGEKCISLCLNLGVMVMIARSLGPEAFGDLNYLLAILAFMTPITALGLNSIITKELLLRKSDETFILGTGLIIRIFGGVIGLMIVLVLMLYTDIAKGFNIELIILAVANIFTCAFIFDFYLQAHLLNHQVVKLRLTVLIFASILRIVGVYFDQSVSYFVSIACIEVIAICLGFLMNYQRNSGLLFKLKSSKSEAVHLLKSASWLILSGVAAIIYLKLDLIMLGQLANSTEVGNYAVASRLSEVWYFIPTAIVTSFFPKLINIKDSKNYPIALQKLNDFLLLLAVAVALPTTLLAEYVILILYGESYIKAGTILSIHIWAGTFIFMRALLSKWLIAENLLKFSLITQFFGAISNVILNLILIPLYGAIGAAIATVISYAFASYFALLLHRDTFPMAWVITKSFFLPVRFLLTKGSLYKPS